MKKGLGIFAGANWEIRRTERIGTEAANEIDLFSVKHIDRLKSK
jgi:hypothetical protein